MESKTKPLLLHVFDIFPEPGFKEKHLLLWGETAPAEPEAISQSARSTKKATKTKFPRLIYDLGIEGLMGALDEFLSGLQLDKTDFEEVAVWLPTVDGQAQASNVLIADPIQSTSPPVLAPWRVTALPLAARSLQSVPLGSQRCHW